MNIREAYTRLDKTFQGRGREVAFGDRVLEYAKTNRVPEYQAEKVLFAGIAKDVRAELLSSGVLQKDSEHYRQFQAALRHSFGGNKDAVRQLEDMVGDKFRTLPTSVSVSVPDELKVKSYFESTNPARKSPDVAVIRDYARRSKELEVVIARFLFDPKLAAHTGKLDTLLLGASPELGADIGWILEEQRKMQRIEVHFGRELTHDTNVENLKATGGNAIKTMLLDAPWRLTKDIGKALFSAPRPLKCTGNIMKALARFGLEEAKAGTKLIYSGTKTAASYVRRELAA